MYWHVLIFLVASSLLSAMDSALIRLGKWEGEQLLKRKSIFPFYNFLIRFLFPTHTWEGFRYTLKTAKYSFRLLFGIDAFLYFDFSNLEKGILTLPATLKVVLMIIVISHLTDFIFTLFTFKKTERFVRLSSDIAFLLCAPILPFAAIGFFIMRFFEPEIFKNSHLTSHEVSQKIRQVIEDSGLGEYVDDADRKLLFSLVGFKDSIAREVMVPRIDVFSLSAGTTVENAAQSVLKEGYSRIPVYKENLDDIIGVLLYKDVLNIYARSDTDPEAALQLKNTIESFVKPVLYTPETKKISHLLQEFRSKQIHMAIVVDEWGGTEGIVTIEDILEELVGEIADEYDTDEEVFYTQLPSGGWVVDAKMSIKDIEEELHIKIPQGPEYDTLGGYIFHKAGEIPSKGWKIHHHDFELEVLSSGERAIEKIHIKPTRT